MSMILTVLRQLQGCEPVISFVHVVPEVKLEERSVSHNDEERRQAMYENAATNMARTHIREFASTFVEFNPQRCRWYAYLVDESKQSLQHGCTCLPLSI